MTDIDTTAEVYAEGQDKERKAIENEQHLCLHFGKVDIVDAVKFGYELGQDDTEELKAQIKKMKCCGNCIHKIEHEKNEWCNVWKEYIVLCALCDKWELAE